MSVRIDETGRRTFGSLLTLLPPDVRSLTRKTEKTAQKVVNRSYGVVFIETCIHENLLPSFIYIYIALDTKIVKIGHLNLLVEFSDPRIKIKPILLEKVATYIRCFHSIQQLKKGP